MTLKHCRHDQAMFKQGGAFGYDLSADHNTNTFPKTTSSENLPQYLPRYNNHSMLLYLRSSYATILSLAFAIIAGMVS